MGPPTDWGELAQADHDRAIFQPPPAPPSEGRIQPDWARMLLVAPPSIGRRLPKCGQLLTSQASAYDIWS